MIVEFFSITVLLISSKKTIKNDRYIHCVSKKDNDVLRYIYNGHQPILIIFGRDIAE